jgi:hypothetical protein
LMTARSCHRIGRMLSPRRVAVALSVLSLVAATGAAVARDTGAQGSSLQAYTLDGNLRTPGVDKFSRRVRSGFPRRRLSGGPNEPLQAEPRRGMGGDVSLAG